jgi:DNA-binding winged helix-turn-helix (wHTH) protein/tetratricopeptide (TPR) repeat protein/TolB-like protein
MAKTELMSFLDFQFDLSSGDLLRGDKRVAMPKQTSRLLEIFLERPGAVVTRAELQQLLWPEGEFLDHEHAINRVIADLRSVFRDNPKNPKYIRTVHKRGYRFIPKISVIPITSKVLSPKADTQREEELPVAESRVESWQAESSLSLVPPDPGSPQQNDTVREVHHRPKRSSERYRWLLLAVVPMLLIIAVAFYRHPPRPPVAETNTVSLGIAPFQTEGSGAEEIGESFRLDLADALAQIPIVQITATHSLNNISRDDSGIRSISEKLHLDMILVGKFRIAGDRCKVEFELVRGRDSLHLASFQYEGSKDELAGVRDKLQRDIFLTLQGTGKSMQAIRGSTDDPQAYGEYLQGRELTRLREVTALNQALGHYQIAIQRDPKFAEAYAGMAVTHLALRYFSSPIAHQNAAKQFAQQALQLDPALAEAHAALGDVALRSEWNFALGESELRRAIELDPRKSTYHAWLASLLVYKGRFDEAMAEIDRAVADDPLWPLVYSMATYVAGVAHDNSQAIAFAQKYQSLVPDSPESHNQLGWAYFVAKRYDEALAEWGRMAEMDKDSARIALEERCREAYHRGGIQAYALVRIEAMERHSPETTRRGNDFDPAEWYAFTGQRDKAISAIQRVITDHDGAAVLLAVNPMLDNLHDDARFVALLHQVGLTLPNYSTRVRIKTATHATSLAARHLVFPITQWHESEVQGLFPRTPPA